MRRIVVMLGVMAIVAALFAIGDGGFMSRSKTEEDAPPPKLLSRDEPQTMQEKIAAARASGGEGPARKAAPVKPEEPEEEYDALRALGEALGFR